MGKLDNSQIEKNGKHTWIDHIVLADEFGNKPL